MDFKATLKRKTLKKRKPKKKGKPMKLAALFATLLLFSCASNQTKTTMLTYEQAARSKEPPEAGPIAVVDAKLHHYRKILVAAGQMGMLDQGGADEITPDLKAADYFMVSAWKFMVEGDVANRDAALKEAERGLKIIEDKMMKIIHVEGDKT